MIINGPKLDEIDTEDKQDIINYENALCMYDEMQLNILKLTTESETISSTKAYVLINRINNRALEACEHFGKALLIHNGLEWSDLKSRNVGHKIQSIINLLPPGQKSYLQFEYRKHTIGSYIDYSPIHNEEKYSKLEEYLIKWNSTDIDSLTDDDIFQRGIITTRYPGEIDTQAALWKTINYKEPLLALVDSLKILCTEIIENNTLESNLPTEEEYINFIITEAQNPRMTK